MRRYDLHCHSTFSDGVLSPAALVARAAANGVNVLALTDHDGTGGIAEAQAAARDAGITLVAGTEVSVTWEETTVHVVGLGIDPADATLTEGLAEIRSGRDARARRIARSLAECGIRGAYEGAKRHVTGGRLISRTHFARYLVEAGYAGEVKDVFKRFLTVGKPGYVPHAWATLAQAVGWIHSAGGQAVLAHPGRYKIDAESLRHLLGEFRDVGGDALEILSPSHSAAQCSEFAAHARVLGLRASGGSDFHAPGESGTDVGAVPPLPSGVVPVWKDW